MAFSDLMNGLTGVNNSVGSFNSTITNANSSTTPGKMNRVNTQVVGITKGVTGATSTISNVGNSIASVSKVLRMDSVSEALVGKDTIKYTPDEKELLTKESYGEITGLKGFYHKFSGNSSVGSNNIDIMNTFECWFEFFPQQKAGHSKDSILDTLIKDHLINTDDYKNFTKEIDSLGSDLYYTKSKKDTCYVDMGIDIQGMTVPNVTIHGNSSAQTIFGEFPLNGTFITTDSHNLVMEILNLRQPIHEMIMYPWMREVQSWSWIYEDQPYTTANIHVSMYEHANVEYVFLNCRPQQIMTYQPSQEVTQSFTRQVTFAFDYMIIKEANSALRDMPAAYGPRGSSGFGILDKKEEKSTLDKVLDIVGATNFAASNILQI